MSMGTLSITDSLHTRVLDWLDRPRTRISVNARTIKNRKADLGTFQHILERYTAEELEDEPLKGGRTARLDRQSLVPIEVCLKGLESVNRLGRFTLSRI